MLPSKSYHLLTFVLLITFSLTGCMVDSTTTTSIENGAITHDQKMLATIRSADTTPTIQGITYTGKAHLTRNFMPSVNPPVRLVAAIEVQTVSQQPIPESLKASQFYIVKGQQVWIPDEIEQKTTSTPSVNFLFARNGPEWQNNTEATVGVKLEDTQRDKIYYLQIPNVSINYIY
ncbi:MAG: hypothetical protein ACQETE_11465 [Bacteroidota bacterium]